jgi:hypothetical protein
MVGRMARPGDGALRRIEAGAPGLPYFDLLDWMVRIIALSPILRPSLPSLAVALHACGNSGNRVIESSPRMKVAVWLGTTG